MRKYLILLALIGGLTFTFSSCNEYRSITNANKLSQLSGNPFMYQLSKSVLKNAATYMAEKAIKSTVGKASLLSPLSGLFSNASDLDGFRSMIGSTYGVSNKKMAAMSQAQNIKDLVMFVAKNGSKFNFYSN